jgi:DNA-binding NtrC family response regulator
VNIHVPPLRERPEDIPVLIEKLTTLESTKINRPAPFYSKQTVELLCQYHWPGNVRELKNLVKRMIILYPGEQITPDYIQKIIIPVSNAHVEPTISVPTLEEAQRQHVERALIECRGVVGGQKGAARLLDIPRSTLQYRLKKLGINPSIYLKHP